MILIVSESTFSSHLPFWKMVVKLPREFQPCTTKRVGRLPLKYELASSATLPVCSTCISFGLRSVYSSKMTPMCALKNGTGSFIAENVFTMCSLPSSSGIIVHSGLSICSGGGFSTMTSTANAV